MSTRRLIAMVLSWGLIDAAAVAKGPESDPPVYLRVKVNLWHSDRALKQESIFCQNLLKKRPTLPSLGDLASESTKPVRPEVEANQWPKQWEGVVPESMGAWNNTVRYFSDPQRYGGAANLSGRGWSLLTEQFQGPNGLMATPEVVAVFGEVLGQRRDSRSAGGEGPERVLVVKNTVVDQELNDLLDWFTEARHSILQVRVHLRDGSVLVSQAFDYRGVATLDADNLYAIAEQMKDAIPKFKPTKLENAVHGIEIVRATNVYEFVCPIKAKGEERERLTACRIVLAKFLTDAAIDLSRHMPGIVIIARNPFQTGYNIAAGYVNGKPL